MQHIQRCLLTELPENNKPVPSAVVSSGRHFPLPLMRAIICLSESRSYLQQSFFLFFFHPADSLCTMKHLLQSAQVESSCSSLRLFDFLRVHLSHKRVKYTQSGLVRNAAFNKSNVRKMSHLRSDPFLHGLSVQR